MKNKWIGLAVAVIMCGGHARADYAGIAVHETAGLDRTFWPVQVGVTVPMDASADSLILAQVNQDGSLQEVTFQLIHELDYHGLDERWRQLRDIKSFEIAFVTQLPAHAELDFRLYYNPPEQEMTPAAESPTLTVETGEGFARTVDTGAARFTFHPASGQLLTYELADTGFTPRFYRSERTEPVHGSGDLRTSRNNVRAWNHEDETHGLSHEESIGPITWQTVRSGYMPHSDRQIEVNVTYIAFAGMPFIITSSHIPFQSDQAVSALRKNQLVFSRGHHTHGVYMTRAGTIDAIRAYDPDHPDTHFGDLGVGSLPPDLPLIGMIHENRGYGIGLVTLDRANLRSRRPLSLPDGGAYYHFLDSSLHGIGNPRNFFYLVRYEAYQGEHRLVVPAGSVFSSTTAILAYPVGAPEDGARFDELTQWVHMLRNPPRIYAKGQ